MLRSQVIPVCVGTSHRLQQLVDAGNSQILIRYRGISAALLRHSQHRSTHICNTTPLRIPQCIIQHM